MNIISLNAGNNFLKFSLYDMNHESVIASGLFERIGLEGSQYQMNYHNNRITQEISIATHQEAVNLLLEKLIDLRIIPSLDSIDGVGHRIVEGMDCFSSSVLIDEDVMERLIGLKDNSPLHSSAEIQCIEAFHNALPEIPMVCVFDTSFHQTMDAEAYLYAVPYRWFQEYGVRKYGFHGISHQYVTECVHDILGMDSFKIISCHLGKGSSVCAIKDMKCIDTSMGFTPLSGVVMGTRSGDIDPSIIPFVMEREGKNASEVVDDLNKMSGLLGLSEYSDNIKDLLERCNAGDEKALLAKNKYVRSIVNYIAQYYVLLGGADAIVLTGKVGEECIPIRQEICNQLACLGVKIDSNQNNICGDMAKISSNDSSMDVYVIPTNEDLLIVRDTYKLINR